MKVKRMNLNVPVDLHNDFKVATTLKGSDMTHVLLEFISGYVKKNLPAALKKKGRKG